MYCYLKHGTLIVNLTLKTAWKKTTEVKFFKFYVPVNDYVISICPLNGLSPFVISTDMMILKASLMSPSNDVISTF